MKIQAKLNSSQGKKAVNRFNLIKKTSIGSSFLIKFDYNFPTDLLMIEYEISKTIWDKNEKDYCIDLFMYDRSNSYLYIYPQASEVYIPVIDMREYFNKLVKEVFGLDIDISKKTLDRLFQTLKLTNNKDERISYIKDCIESCIGVNSRTNLGRLLNRDSENNLIDILEVKCRLLEYQFTQNLINFIETVNLIISDIDLRSVSEGLFNSNILIHKGLRSFFELELWNKIKNIFGVYDKDFIESGCISGLIPEMSMNILFLPIVQDYLDLELLNLEELDKKYFEISNQAKNEYLLSREYCIKDSDIFCSMIKVLNLIDLLPEYELGIFQVVPNLTVEELKDSRFLDYFNYKNNQLITLAEFNKVKKFYSSLSNSDIAVQFTNKYIEDNDINNLPDSNLIVLSRKISDLMVMIFNKYFV